MPPPRVVVGWLVALNESPSEKEGKFPPASRSPSVARPLNESPSEKEGKLGLVLSESW